MKLQTAKFGCSALFAAVVAILLIPACGFWIRSYWVADDIGLQRPGRFTRVCSSGGGLLLARGAWPGKPKTRTTWEKSGGAPQYPFATTRVSTFSHRCGFLVSARGFGLMFVVPYWSIIGSLTAMLILSVVVLCKQPTRLEQG